MGKERNNSIFKVTYAIFMITYLLSNTANAAYVSYSQSINQIGIYGTGNINLTELYKAVNNESLVSHDNDIWYLNSSIRIFDGANLFINDSEVSELRISNPYSNYGFYRGNFYIENITIGTWNYKENRYAGRGEAQEQIEVDSGTLKNLKVYGISRIWMMNMAKDEIVNVSMWNGNGIGLLLDRQHNNKIHKINIYNYGTGGLYIRSSNNTEVYNVHVDGAGDNAVSGTDQYGIQIRVNPTTKESSHGVILHDAYVNNTGWSGIDESGVYNVTLYNLTIQNAGHNGLDMHGGSDHCVKNITVNNSRNSNNNVLLTCKDSYFKDLCLYNSTGDQILISNAGFCTNNTLENIYMEYGGRGIVVIDATNTTIINATGIGNRNWITLDKYVWKNENTTIIDGNFADGSVRFFRTTGNKIINTYSNAKLYYIGPYEDRNYYYLDVFVKNKVGNPISGAKITIQNEISPLNQTINGYVDEQTEFYTNFTGHTSTPINRSYSPIIAEYHKNTTSIQQFIHTVGITTQEQTIYLSGITPDSSWYRKDPNVPTYTITAIIPDDSKGPHLTGFAPSKENPFNPGEKKNFRVWTDEPLTTMEWYVDGSDLPVSKGSLNYALPVTEGKHTIKFVGSNANGTVSKVWDLGGSSDEPSVPGDDDPIQEIKFSPADAVLTRNVSEKTIFSVSPDIFTTKEWYINGEPVLKNMASMSQSWDAAGTYKVTFSGSGSGGTVSHTWAVNVVEEPKEEEQDRSVTMIAPEYQIITPKQSFGLNIIVDPSIPITGAQLDFIFDSSMVSANGATEGNLFKQNGAQTLFSSGTIDKSAGTVKNIYGLIIGTSNVSSPGTMATVNLTAGNRTGIAEFSLSNVIISNTSSKPVPITIKNATVLIDTAPVMNQICCPKSVNEKSTLTFKVSARDADGDRLILSDSGLPQGAVFNTTSGTFTWTPERGQAGTYTLTFKVSDGYLTDSGNVTVTVNKLNNLPVINFFEPLNGAFFSEGEKINISVNASDADRQALNYSIRIDGVEYSTGPAYVWETGYSSSGNRTIEVAVSDGIDEVKEQHTIFINNYHPRWDVNEDGIVNILDITIIAQNYGSETKKPYPRWDINQDGVINIQDLTLAGYYFGEIVI